MTKLTPDPLLNEAAVYLSNVLPRIVWKDVELPMPGLDQDDVDADIKAVGESRLDLLKVFDNRLRGLFAKLADNLEQDGHRIFHVVTENDDISVEADYGAPSVGLTFAGKLIDFEKAYRYPRLRTVEGGYKTFHENAMKVGAYLKRQGYGVFYGLKPEQFPSQIMFVNGGVTNGFNILMRKLVSFHDKLNEIRENYDGIKKGAILVPVPTYGLFLYLLNDIVDGKDIELIPVRRSENGAVIPSSLQNALNDCDARDVRVLAYYDCNPHNPTGYIRQEAETREIAKIIEAYNEKNLLALETASEAPDLPDGFKKFLMQAQHPAFQVMMVDDMAYEGLEYDPRNRPFSFSQVLPEVAQQSVTLKGISKIGLPGARIGMMIGSHDIIDALCQSQLIAEFCASSMGVDIITARYSDNKHQALFSRHKSVLRQKHKHNSIFLEALFQGFDENHSFSASDKERAIRKYARHQNISVESAAGILDKGLPKFYMYPNTQCGFFKLANFDFIRGQKLHFYQDEGYMINSRIITTGHDMWTVLKGFGIDVVPLSWAGVGHHSMDARISLSLKDEDIFTMYDRFRDMHDYFFGLNPEIQLDYLRSPSLSL